MAAIVIYAIYVVKSETGTTCAIALFDAFLNKKVTIVYSCVAIFLIVLQLAVEFFCTM